MASVSILETKCRFGVDTSSAPTLLLLGDSHANHFRPFLDVLAKDANVSAVYSVQGGCDPLLGLEEPFETSSCAMRNRMLFGRAKFYKFIAIAAEWRYQGNDTAFNRRLTIAVKKIRSAGATPIIFKDTPSFSSDLSHCVLKRNRGWIKPDADCSIPIAYVQAAQGSADAVIDDVAANNTGTIVINPKPLMCDDRACRTYESNVAYFRDSNHINALASNLLGQKFLSAKGNPLRVDKN